MPFSPTVEHESKTLAGARFTVHRIGFGRRTELDQKTVVLRQRLRELELDYPPQSPREKELARQLEIASQKYLAVPLDEAEGVLIADVEPIAQQLGEAASIEARKKRKALDEEYSSVQAQIHCIWIRFGFVSLAHKDLETGGPGEWDGVTVDQLLDCGPQDLGREIFEAIANGGRVAGKEAELLKSPGISGAAVPTPTNNTTAPGAEPEAGTRNETASSTSPAT